MISFGALRPISIWMSKAQVDDALWLGEWTFRRRSDRCTIRRVPDGNVRCLLTVDENGRTRTYGFSSLDRLIAFQADMEAFFVRTGWTLEAFAPERRAGRDRRNAPRVGNDRRRWWTDPTRPESG